MPSAISQPRTPTSLNRDELESMLLESFITGVEWPLDRASLAALSDMGMSVAQIARHFRIAPSGVRALMDSSAST
jgi:hypothetical protein